MSDESLSRVQRLRAALTTQHLPCDIWLIVAVVALAGLGWIMVSSASVGLLENSYHYSRQHGIFLLLAIVALVTKGFMCLGSIRDAIPDREQERYAEEEEKCRHLILTG